MKTEKLIHYITAALKATLVELQYQQQVAGVTGYHDKCVDAVILADKILLAELAKYRVEDRIFTLAELQLTAEKFVSQRDNKRVVSWNATDQVFGKQELARFFTFLQR